ncbi:MAG: hypothetical protein H7X86_02960 [Gorillibacterium sp.]|nr:hypothetical protein [Gorillibacterium sp.]
MDQTKKKKLVGTKKKKIVSNRKKTRPGRQQHPSLSMNHYIRFFLPPRKSERLSVNRKMWNRIALELPRDCRQPDIDIVNFLARYQN